MIKMEIVDSTRDPKMKGRPSKLETFNSEINFTFPFSYQKNIKI